MDRPIIYTGEIPRSTDVLNGWQQAMIGLGHFIKMVLGTNTWVEGLACTPQNPASLSVNVGAGQIYALDEVDASGYGSLPANTLTIMKQGLVTGTTALSCPAPSTSGDSINYLIEAAYIDQDADPVVLPYYNAANPSQALSGPGNNGAPQNTIRQGLCNLVVKAGAAATTGSQTTPAPDTGYVGLWVVTVAAGATTITATNIAAYPGAPIISNLLTMVQTSALFNAPDTGSANGYAMALQSAITAYTPGMLLSLSGIKATNNGASTLAVNGLPPIPIQGPGATALQGGELVASYGAILRVNAAATAVELIQTTGGSLPVKAATATNQAANLGQVLPILGRNNQVVYTASSTITAVNAGQIVTYNGTAAATFTLPSSNATAAGLLPIVINNASSYALTVALPSGDTGGLRVNVLQPGQKAALWNDGTNAWIELWNEAGNSSPTVTGNATASNQAVALGQFIESHGSSGYEKLPGGRIRQWATGAAAAANTNQTVNLPIAFPTAIDSILASSSAVGTFATASPNGTSLSSVLASASNTGGSFTVFVEGY